MENVTYVNARKKNILKKKNIVECMFETIQINIQFNIMYQSFCCIKNHIEIY